MFPSVEWCSFCGKKPADGIATVKDPDNGMMDLPLCSDCVKEITPPSEQYSLGIK